MEKLLPIDEMAQLSASWADNNLVCHREDSGTGDIATTLTDAEKRLGL